MSEDGSKHMKKKLLIIPVTIMCTLLGACSPSEVREERPAINIDRWLEAAKDPSKDSNPGKFWYRDDKDIKPEFDDYDLKVRDIILGKVKNKKGAPTKKRQSSINYVSYEITSYIDRYYRCSITIFDNGTIETYASAYGKLSAPKDQRFIYTLGESVTSEIISEVKERYAEIETTINNQYEVVKERASLDKFFASVEDSEMPALVSFSEMRQNKGQNEFTFHDDDCSILNELKELEYQEKEKGFTTGVLPMLKYGFNRDWLLNIYCTYEGDVYTASISVTDDGPYQRYQGFIRYYEFFYSINQVKAEALITRISNN